MNFTSEEKNYLISLARAGIEAYFRTGARQRPATFPEFPILQQQLGVFVTLTMGTAHELRGCIGRIESREPLWWTVLHCAVGAAFEDSRFSPLTVQEYGQVHVGISVLSALERVGSYLDIELGVHGVVLKKNGRSAVFLPEVAVEQGWDLPTMLTYLAQKAGLSGQDWQSGAEFWVFTSEKFGD